MKVAFYLDINDDLLRACALKAVLSVREHIPAAEIVQLGCADPVDGVDVWLRSVSDNPFVYRRMSAQAALDGDCIFIDVDVKLRADVSDVFKYEFDAAIPTDTMPGDSSIRFDGGVAFSRNPEVWKALRDHVGHLDFRKAPNDWKPIMEAQTAFFEKRLFKTLVLPGELYCRIPESKEDACDGAKVIHYRGLRKEWM